MQILFCIIFLPTCPCRPPIPYRRFYSCSSPPPPNARAPLQPHKLHLRKRPLKKQSLKKRTQSPSPACGLFGGFFFMSPRRFYPALRQHRARFPQQTAAFHETRAKRPKSTCRAPFWGKTGPKIQKRPLSPQGLRFRDPLQSPGGKPTLPQGAGQCGKADAAGGAASLSSQEKPLRRRAPLPQHPAGRTPSVPPPPLTCPSAAAAAGTARRNPPPLPPPPPPP